MERFKVCNNVVRSSESEAPELGAYRATMLETWDHLTPDQSL